MLNYAGTEPVAMESPNPHADWSYENVNSSYPDNATQSVTAGEFIIHPASVAWPYTFNGFVDVFLTYTGAATINVALSWSNSAHFYYVQGEARRIILDNTVGGGDGIIWMTDTSSTSGSFAVPYYRYRLRLYIYASGNTNLTTADWVKLAVTLT